MTELSPTVLTGFWVEGNRPDGTPARSETALTADDVEMVARALRGWTGMRIVKRVLSAEGADYSEWTPAVSRDGAPARPLVAAPELRSLWDARHYLPPDVLRSLAGVWVCAAAMLYPGCPPTRFWREDRTFFTRHDTARCDRHRRPADPPSPTTLDEAPPVDDATALLFTRRHRLHGGELRTLGRIWSCGSAARYGAPHETFWDDLDEDLAGHDLTECTTGEAP